MAGKLSRALKIHLASFPRWCYGRAASEQKGQGAGFREEGEPGKGSRSQASGSKSPPHPPNTWPHPLPLVWCCQQRHVPGWVAPWGSADVALPLAHEESVPGGDLTDATHAAGAPICLLWGPLPLQGSRLGDWGPSSFPRPPPALLGWRCDMQVSVNHGEPSRGEGLWWKWLKALPASAAWSQGQNSLKKTYLEPLMPKRGPEWGRVTSPSKGEKGQDVNVPRIPPAWA